MREKEIVAVVGMTGSGKSLVSDFLTSKGYKFIRFGQITLDEVKRRGLFGEAAEKEVREGFRKQLGMGAFAILNKPKIDDLLKEGSVVVDGLYSWSEYKFLKDTYGDMLKILAVIAPPKLRYDRLENRKEIDEQMRNRPTTRVESKSRDYAEIENIEKAGPIAMADITIINDGTRDDLIKKLNKIFDECWRPSWDEYFIDIVKVVAERGTCNRGRTGCVIVRDKQILVTGYVGSPRGIPHCDEVGHQMKSVVHEDGSVSQHCMRTAHAEVNAIAQAARLGISVLGATLYCKMAPCPTCAKMIINAGIKRVVAERRYHQGGEAENLFKTAGIEFSVLYDEVIKYNGQ